MKAAEERSAFVRWRHQVLDLGQGVNLWDRYFYPNPPILPISLYPLMILPPVTGALLWFAAKSVMVTVAALACFRMVREGAWELAPWDEGLILFLSLRPILSDLHHGNINLLILFLVVMALGAWRKGWDVLAGLMLALAIAYKVTPALFVPYFLYKRSWRTVGACLLGIGVYLLLIPSLVLGPEFNGQCLASWWQRTLSPYLVHDIPSQQEPNQSMVGVLTRLLTETRPVDKNGYGGTVLDLNLVSWPPEQVALMVKGLSIGLVGLLALLCRTRAERRDDPRLFGEFALVVLTMLFVSERSWKHHYVTLLLPFTYLVACCRRPGAPWRVRAVLGSSLVLATLLIASTSSELGGLFHRHGHKIAQFYGMFFWAGVVLYAATAWRVAADWQRPMGSETDLNRSVPPAPHLANAPQLAFQSQWDGEEHG
ncbi:MAG: DUF2029 domain-containing protein [Isosphaeraceae bacterium]|nr:DUF2029 domain-containing protein [Isosphaeraceae bacterium]